MAFLTPLFLFALLAVSVPIAIHLIRRDKPPSIAFSSLRFFQSSTRKQFMLQKFQQWLLLLLRALVISLLVLAFARPFFDQAFSAWTNMAPRATVVLVDASMSMRYDDYLDRAKTRARQIFNELSPGDEATLIVFTDKARSVHGPTRDFTSLQAVLDTTVLPSFEATRYFPVLRLADDLLARSAMAQGRIHLISDFQASAMTGFDKSWRLSPGVDFAGENLFQNGRKNFTITGIRLPSHLYGAEVNGDLLVRIRSTGNQHASNAEMVLVLNGEEQHKQEVELGDQSEIVVTLPLNLSNEGSHEGWVSIEDEHFTVDNRFYFTLDVPGKIPVLVVRGGTSKLWYEDESHWLNLAISSHERSPFLPKVVEERAFNVEELDQYQIVVLLDVAALSEQKVAALEDFVQSGGSLLLAPAGRVQAGDFNRQLGRLSPGTLVDRGELTRGDYLLVAERQHNHPILRPLDGDWLAHFTDFWSLKTHESSEVLMRFDNGEPALVERELGEGRSMIFASSLDLQWNNFPLQGMYLPFIHETLRYLAKAVEKQSFYQISDSIPLLNSDSTAQLTGPDEKQLALPEGAESFTLQAPGIYRYQTAEHSLSYAANTPREESDFSGISPAQIYDQIINPETAPSQSPQVRAQLLKMELEKPQRLWWWFLLAVAALLAVESVTANRTYR